MQTLTDIIFQYLSVSLARHVYLGKGVAISFKAKFSYNLYILQGHFKSNSNDFRKIITN